MSELSAIAHIDGGSRGNPGPSAYAVVFERLNCPGVPIIEDSNYIGWTTNNMAEYRGLLGALDLAVSLHCHHVAVVSDSELLVKQMNGLYKVRDPDLQNLHLEALSLIERLSIVSILHVRRAKNKRADKLCSLVLDRVVGDSHAARKLLKRPPFIA